MPASDKTESNSLDNWLERIARLSAWVLLTGIMVLVVSGWGITRTGIIYRASGGLIDRRLADAVHRAVNFPLAVFFLAHVLIRVKLGLASRYARRGWLVGGSLVAVGVLALLVMLYMEYIARG